MVCDKVCLGAVATSRSSLLSRDESVSPGDETPRKGIGDNSVPLGDSVPR